MKKLILCIAIIGCFPSYAAQEYNDKNWNCRAVLNNTGSLYSGTLTDLAVKEKKEIENGFGGTLSSL